VTLKGPPGRVLVTGGAGFIGSHVAEGLRRLGWQVEALDNLSTGDPANLPGDVPLHVADLRSDEEINGVFAATGFDFVVHCAAQTSVERSMKSPALDHAVNVGGTQRLLKAALESGVQRFVLISSGGAIYGDTEAAADEDTMPAPRSYYGLDKYAAEEFVRASGVPSAILRPSNVYGPRQRADAEGGVVAIFHSRLRGDQPLQVHGDGRQTRDFVHVSDVTSAVIAALSAEDDVLWNVASGEATTILQLAEHMATEIGRVLHIDYLPARPGDVQSSLLSPARLLATGLWAPPLTLRQGLARLFRESAPAPVVPS